MLLLLLLLVSVDRLIQNLLSSDADLGVVSDSGGRTQEMSQLLAPHGAGSSWRAKANPASTA